MTFILFILLIMAIIFTCVCFHLSAKLDDANRRIAILEIKANYYEQSEKTLRESVDLQTKCIRDLNDIVRKSVENKEPMKPDTKALLAGWIVEEPEPPKKQPRPIDVFRMQKLINWLQYKNMWTTVYPWQLAEIN